MNFNFSVLFVLLLKVLTVLSTKCRTSQQEVGKCTRQIDCVGSDVSRPLTRCGKTGLHCCPPVSPLLESKFPTDCGQTPMHAKLQIHGGKIVAPDEYSWLANLRYGNQSLYGVCSGSVINTRYVLTAAHCVTGPKVEWIGGLAGVRLGAYDENGDICDYGTVNCTHYQEYGIEKVIPHSEYFRRGFRSNHDIALIRLDKPIQFGPNIKPICLPFAGNRMENPAVNELLTVTGWGITMELNEFPAKRDVSLTLWDNEGCRQSFQVNDSHMCAVATDKNSCAGDSGGPLMKQFRSRHMVLEGIVSAGISNCSDTRYPGIYTRVREYRHWLNENMEF